MKNIDNIIKETTNNYISNNIIKEYNATTEVATYFKQALDMLYKAYNAMINDINLNANNKMKYSKNEFVVKQIERDIKQLTKDINLLN